MKNAPLYIPLEFPASFLVMHVQTSDSMGAGIEVQFTIIYFPAFSNLAKVTSLHLKKLLSVSSLCPCRSCTPYSEHFLNFSDAARALCFWRIFVHPSLDDTAVVPSDTTGYTHLTVTVATMALPRERKRLSAGVNAEEKWSAVQESPFDVAFPVRRVSPGGFSAESTGFDVIDRSNCSRTKALSKRDRKCIFPRIFQRRTCFPSQDALPVASRLHQS